MMLHIFFPKSGKQEITGACCLKNLKKDTVETNGGRYPVATSDLHTHLSNTHINAQKSIHVDVQTLPSGVKTLKRVITFKKMTPQFAQYWFYNKVLQLYFSFLMGIINNEAWGISKRCYFFQNPLKLLYSAKVHIGTSLRKQPFLV